MKLSEKQKGILALIGLAFTYASFGFFTRYLSVSFGFFQQLYLRLFAGLIIGFLIFKKQFDFSKLKKISLNEWLLLIFRASSYYLLGAALFNKAVLITKISTVAFIGSIPMTAMLGFLILKEKVTFKKVEYLTLSFIGVVIISVNSFSNFSFGQGEMLAIISNVFAALSIIFRKYQTKLLNNFEMTQIMLCIATVLFIGVSIIFGERLPVNNWNLGVTLIILAAGLANSLMMFFTNYGFEKVKTSVASNILTLEMFFALLIGFIFYREFPSLKEMLGGILILFSVIQMNKLE